jgi:hypothetical protein
MAINLDALVIQIIASTIIMSPVMWLAGKYIVGADKAKFSDAVWIVVIGTVVGTVLGNLFSGLIGAIIQFVVWLYIVKHYFDTDWMKAFIISIVSVIVFIVIAIILGIIGFAIFSLI